MALPSTLVDRVKIFSASSGSGPFTLGAAVPAFRGSEVLVDGDIYSYAVESGADFEAGQGEYVAATNTIIRSPQISSLGGAPVPFQANVPITFTALASDLTATGSATDAAASAQAAADSAASAEESALLAENSATAAAASEATVAASATAAATSATNAGNSATAASGSATAASTSATNAANSASTAATSATNAGNSATAASGSATTASTAATDAANSETAAAGSATAAGNSATAAAGSASDAATAATNAGNSATAASGSATAASTSATNAANSASTAATSATNAGNSATAAAGSASTAATAATEAEQALAELRDELPDFSYAVTTLPAGSNATLVGSGIYPNLELSFGVPRGDKGDKGDPGEGGQVNSVTQGTGIAVNAVDPINPSVALNAASIASLALADSAVQPAALDAKIDNSIFTAGQQILISTSANNPSRTETIPANSLVGRAATGGIKGMAAAEGRAALGLGGAAVLNVGTTAGTVAAGNHTHPDATTTVSGFMSAGDKEKLNGIDLSLYIPLAQKGAANGVADLDATGKIQASQLPAIAITDTFVVASQAAMLALTAQVGDIAVRTDISQSFVLRVEPATTLGNWTQLLTPASGVTSVSGASSAGGFSLSGTITSTGSLTFSVSNAATARTTLGLGTIATLAAPAGAVVGTTGAQTLTSKTLTSPVIDGYTEGNATASGAAFSPNLAVDTLFFYTTTGNATITLPTPTVGKSFTIVVQYGGAHTLSWGGGSRKWPGGEVPTATSIDGVWDVFTFICADGANWAAFQSGADL